MTEKPWLTVELGAPSQLVVTSKPPNHPSFNSNNSVPVTSLLFFVNLSIDPVPGYQTDPYEVALVEECLGKALFRFPTNQLFR